jgi:pimeloyl-ACP methyl ester carboxylesterase
MRYSVRKRLPFGASKPFFQDKNLLFDGHNLHYIETGNAQKPTLIFLHGSPGSWNAFKEYLQDTTLLKKYRDCY